MEMYKHIYIIAPSNMLNFILIKYKNDNLLIMNFINLKMAR